jgi:hypothetical protein
MDALPEVHISFVAGTRYLRFRQNGKKIAETLGPAFLEINILRMSDLQRGIEGSEAQRYNERFVLDGAQKRRVEDPATIAWKLSTGAYYKDGGRPWQLADVRPGVCYVGLAYKRRDPTGDDRFAVCAAQVFLSSGEGVVFRGALGPWYRADSEQFHLDELAARNLLKMVIDEYRGQHNNEPPAELFLHAKSSFTDEEWKGIYEWRAAADQCRRYADCRWQGQSEAVPSWQVSRDSRLGSAYRR